MKTFIRYIILGAILLLPLIVALTYMFITNDIQPLVSRMDNRNVSFSAPITIASVIFAIWVAFLFSTRLTDKIIGVKS